LPRVVDPKDIRPESTGYQNGIDWHLDWGASQFLTKTLQAGAVGYFYNQLTPDHGCSPSLCPFASTHKIGLTIGDAMETEFLVYDDYLVPNER